MGRGRPAEPDSTSRSYKRCRPRLFLRALMDVEAARAGLPAHGAGMRLRQPISRGFCTQLQAVPPPAFFTRAHGCGGGPRWAPLLAAKSDVAHCERIRSNVHVNDQARIMHHLRVRVSTRLSGCTEGYRHLPLPHNDKASVRLATFSCSGRDNCRPPRAAASTASRPLREYPPRS